MNNNTSYALSDVYGKIEQILLSYPDVADNAKQIHDRYAGLLRALPRETKFVILAQFNPKLPENRSIPRFARKVKDQVAALLRDVEIESSYLEDVIIEPLFDYREFHEGMRISGKYSPRHYYPSEWVQDPFVVLKSHENTYALLEPIQFKRSNISKLGDQLIADYVAAQLDFFVKPFPFQLEGGNLLVGDRFALLGSDILYKNWLLFRESMGFADITNHFKWSFGIENIIWLGAESGWAQDYSGLENDVELLQLLPHLDMFVTLGGKTASGDDLVFVAELTDDSCFAVDDNTRNRYNNYFDQVAYSLRAYRNDHVRFKVERLPIILYNIGDMVFMPYNNCLVEQYDDVKNAYIPCFTPQSGSFRSRFQLVEDAAVKIFEEQQFNVKVVAGNYNTKSRLNGSLHCMAKALKRSHYGEVGRAAGLKKPESFWLSQSVRNYIRMQAVESVPTMAVMFRNG